MMTVCLVPLARCPTSNYTALLACHHFHLRAGHTIVKKAGFRNRIGSDISHDALVFRL